MSLEANVKSLVTAVDNATAVLDRLAKAIEGATHPIRTPEHPAPTPDPEPEKIAEKVAESTLPAAVTIDDLREQLKTITEKHGREVGRTLIKGVLAKHSIGKVTDAPETQWPAIHADLQTVADKDPD